MASTITYTRYTTQPQPHTNGIIGAGDCTVSPNAGMQIQVSTGQAWIYGTFSHTGDPFSLTVSNNNTGSIRYDLVVIHIDLTANTADYRILTGNLNPQQDNTVWELPLAGIGVPNGAVSISGANIQDLRIISDDQTAKNLCTLTNTSDTAIPAGAIRTMAWSAPSQANDPYRYYTLNNYIGIRVSCLYNVQSQIRWVPDSTNTKPVVFTIHDADETFNTREIYTISSVQLAAGNVDFTFNQQLFLKQGHYIFMTVRNTTEVNITVKSTASVSPFMRLQITAYPLQAF
jgi:hypothetical protein